MTSTEEALANLGRRSRVGGALSLAGAVIVFAAFGVSIAQLRSLEAHKAQVASEIDALSQQKAELAAQVASLHVKVSDQQDVIGNAQLKIAAGEAPAAASILSASSTAEPVVKRVYFQARSEDQVAIFKRCAGTLLAKGYRVPKLEMVPNTGPQKTSVRYFHDGEGDEAAQVARDLGDCAGTSFTVSRVGGYEHSAAVRPHQFEVWFARDLSAPQPSQAAPQSR